MEDLLIRLFPEMQMNGKKSMGKDYFTIPFENKWFHFPLSSVSEREKVLLRHMMDEEKEGKNLQKHPWAQFLVEGASPIPSGYENVQLLQFVLQLSNENEIFDEQLWLDSLKNTLLFVKEGFFVSKNYGVIVLSNLAYIDLHDEINGVLNVLDDDFAIRSSVYLGQNWPVNEDLPAIFAEEQRIFRDNHSSSKRSKISRLPEIALLHYAQKSAFESPILHSLKEKIKEVDGGSDLVVSMWNNQGNISKAASDLFVHRNTLQYRLDRFFDAVGLNLKNMDDLLLGYLATISRTEGVNLG